MNRPGIRRLLSLPLRRRDRWKQEVEEEILSHLTTRAERLMALGMSPRDARDEALRRFGPLDEARDEMLDAAIRRSEAMTRRERLAELRQDLSFALRTLSRNKGWTVVAIVTLALGIGAATAVWSAASTLLLSPLAYPDARRVVNVSLLPTTGNSTGVDVAVTAELKLLDAWRRDARSFEAIEPYRSYTQSLGTGLSAEDVVTTRILPSFIRFTGGAPIVGRGLTEADTRSGEPVALLGESVWRTRFGGDRGIVGRRVIVSGKPVTIVGVLPATVQTPRLGSKPTGLWMPIERRTETHGMRVVARLRPGIPASVAARELDSVTARASTTGGGQAFRAAVTSPGETVSFRESLVMLAGVVLLVLIVAAANVAHLLLARAITRQREVAIRTALGASRGRLLRQMLTETLLLTGLGCGLGALLGYGALKAIVTLRPPTLPELQLAHVDWASLALVIIASLACSVGFALIAVLMSRGKPGVVLRSAVGSVTSRAGERFRSTLVVTEMAVSAMLLIGALLLARTVMAMQRTDLGFDPRNLHAIVPDLPKDRYPTHAARLAAMRTLADAMRSIPGIGDMTITDAVPSYRNFAIGTLQVEGQPQPKGKATSFIDVGGVTSSYFRTLGAQAVEGRLTIDSTPGSREIVINEAFARTVWKPGEAIGRKVRVYYPGEESEWQTIVGVVRDISTMGPVGERNAPFLYTPLTESNYLGIVYRTDGQSALPQVVRARALALFGRDVRLQQHEAQRTIDNTLAPSRFIMLLVAGFTLLAVVLAAIGLYGMMAYAVAQRTREIGIRIALGATRDTIARNVVGRGALLGAVGAGLGLVLATWGTRIIEGSLYGVSRLDATSFALGGAGLVVIAIVASLVPMRRAVRVDPMTAIRGD